MQKQARFHEYRYQILPISQQLQLDWISESEIKSVDDLRARKNKFFAEVVKNINSYMYSRAPVTHKKLSITDDIFVIQLGVERDLKRKTREFKLEAVENWPTVIVAINNKPDIQKVLIQEKGGFQQTSTVAKLLHDNFNKHLKRYYLSIYFEPIYETHYFWDLVDKYQNKITQAGFELISPNMSNISGGLKLDLGALNRTSNTKTTRLQLNSDDGASLTLSKNDELISGLVDYSSRGGGDISLRVKGLRKKVHTSSGINEVDIDELQIETSNATELAELFRDITQ